MSIIRAISFILGLSLSLTLFIFLDSINLGIPDQPETADVIILLGGGDEGRMAKAAELYREGYANFVMITPVIEYEHSNHSVQTAVRHGIPESQLILEHNAISTYTNATTSMALMREHNFESALVVTSDYHIKRSKFIFNRVNDGSFTFKFISALSADGNHWYELHYAKMIWQSEFVKMWGYRFGMYRFFSFGG